MVIQATCKYSIKIMKAESLKKLLTKCSKCETEIKLGEEYNHHLKILCEDCCIDIRMPRVRKMHWQYLGSIKIEYLIQSKHN